VGRGLVPKAFRRRDQSERKAILLDIDGAMAYATVWLNDRFVGGWPYGYASFELDLSFVAITVADRNGLMVPRAKNHLNFSITGPGEIIAVIIRTKSGQNGAIKLKAPAEGLASAEIIIASK
jgi:hypothetical protein